MNILLVDDHEVVRLGLKSLIERHTPFQVIAEAGNADEAVAKAKEHRPDLVLMDVRLAGSSGIDACELITQALPETKVIMLTSYAEDEILFAAIRAGASGYVLKQVGSGELLRVLEVAARGESVIDPSLTQKLLTEVKRHIQQDEKNAFSELTEQEKHVLWQISLGKKNREIAEILSLSPGTVRNYVSNILNKLSVSNRAEAAGYAVRNHIKEYINKRE